MDHQKEYIIRKGKTKKIWEVVDHPDKVIIENKNDITAFDDPSFTKQFEKKSEYSTTTTCCVFELLQRQGIPTAYIKQLSPTEFLSQKCEMIPLEVVMRRYAVGSFVSRNPEYFRNENEEPYRLHRLLVEYFLKTNKKKLINKDGKVLIQKLETEDPLIEDAYQKEWVLRHPKYPETNPKSKLKQTFDSQKLDNANMIDIHHIENIARNIFIKLGWAWKTLAYELIDLKIEFGFNPYGNIVLADVIDNDNWRLRNQNWLEVSKELFRQGEDIKYVANNYELIARLSKQFRIR